jgi:hypothetical protein
MIFSFVLRVEGVGAEFARLRQEFYLLPVAKVMRKV